MKRVFMTIIALSLLLMPSGVYAQSGQMPKGTPPVAQPLVPEGDFALKLVPALGLGTPTSEAQAEDMLTSVGIEPRNGWIADYPVTPDIIGELQNAVTAAADSKKLPMEKDEALNAFKNLITEFDLAVWPGSSGKSAESQVEPNPTVINSYYYEEGPPVVTYYPPPWDYYYLYAWVPYPFWYSGFFFPGFFALHDFHRVVRVGHRQCVVSNHFFDHKTNRVFAIDPARRRTGETFRTTDISRNRGLNTSDARRGAESISERSRERATTVTTGKGFNGSNFVSPKTGGRSEEQRFTNKGNPPQTFNKGSDRSVSQPSNVERRNEMNFRGPTGGEGKSFKTPSVTGGRSFSSPSAGSRSFGSSESSGRSFSAPGRSFSAPSGGSSSSCANCHGGSSSFGRSGGGSSSRSFSGGSHGGGSGGSHGGGGGFSGGHGGGGRGR